MVSLVLRVAAGHGDDPMLTGKAQPSSHASTPQNATTASTVSSARSQRRCVTKQRSGNQRVNRAAG